MKKICLCTALLCSLNCYATAKADATSKEVLHPTLLFNFFVGINGTLTMQNDSIFFSPKEYDKNNIFQRFFYHDQYNHLITSLRIPLSKVAKIARRNPFLIYPTKFIIEMQDGKKYRFFSYRRGRVIKNFKEYQARNN